MKSINLNNNTCYKSIPCPNPDFFYLFSSEQDKLFLLWIYSVALMNPLVKKKSFFSENFSGVDLRLSFRTEKRLKRRNSRYSGSGTGEHPKLLAFSST